MKWDVGQKKVMICQVEDKTRWFLKEDQEEPGQGWVSERSWLALHAMDVPSNSVCIQQSTRGPSTEPCQQATDCIRLCSCLVAQSCPILCNLIDCSPPGSSVHGVPQARILEWVAILFSRVSSWPINQTQVFCIAGRFFIIWATREAPFRVYFHLYFQSWWRLLNDSWMTKKRRCSLWGSDANLCYRTKIIFPSSLKPNLLAFLAFCLKNFSNLMAY